MCLLYLNAQYMQDKIAIVPKCLNPYTECLIIQARCTQTVVFSVTIPDFL